MQLSLRYDLRAPAFGPPPAELYRAFLDQVAWADELGFDRVVLSEHHAAQDGYLPSPLVAAAAVAGRTRRVRIQLSALLLPLYDPVRLAEDVAVLDLCSGGRVELVLGAGYRAEEMAMFGRTLADRPRLVEEGVAVLRAAWSGEPFPYRGVTVRVTPRPVQQPHPVLILGGSSAAAARRAARLGLPFLPAVPHVFADYEAECERLGVVPGPRPSRGGPLFLHLAEDPDAAWARIAPHALHETNSYGRWLAEGSGAGPYREVRDAGELRAGPMYRVMTPEACVAMCEALPPDAGLVLHPLMGGLPPDLAWESLRLFETRVLPNLPPAGGGGSRFPSRTSVPPVRSTT